jgi:hypothetical protein
MIRQISKILSIHLPIAESATALFPERILNKKYKANAKLISARNPLRIFRGLENNKIIKDIMPSFLHYCFVIGQAAQFIIKIFIA